jgi:glucose/arabinose dehydrogenase
LTWKPASQASLPLACEILSVWLGKTQTGMLWTVVNERDELGSDLVPDYLTSVKDGGFYGWPFSYWGQQVDDRVELRNAELVAKAIIPDYALGNHTAPLGLTFSAGTSLPEKYRNGVFIGQHGSWNRIPKSGYKVIFVPFADGRPSGQPTDILTGFLNEDGEAFGRPVGVAMADHLRLEEQPKPIDKSDPARAARQRTGGLSAVDEAA